MSPVIQSEFRDTELIGAVTFGFDSGNGDKNSKQREVCLDLR
jgi:hypothetical protein